MLESWQPATVALAWPVICYSLHIFSTLLYPRTLSALQPVHAPFIWSDHLCLRVVYKSGKFRSFVTYHSSHMLKNNQSQIKLLKIFFFQRETLRVQTNVGRSSQIKWQVTGHPRLHRFINLYGARHKGR
jgi:hypothetical protein